MSGTLTLEALGRAIQSIPKAPPAVKLIRSTEARTPDRPVTWVTMPWVSRQPRSKRLTRKLLRQSARPGVTWDPLILMAPDGRMIVHPTLYRGLEARLARLEAESLVSGPSALAWLGYGWA